MSRPGRDRQTRGPGGAFQHGPARRRRPALRARGRGGAGVPAAGPTLAGPSRSEPRAPRGREGGGAPAASRPGAPGAPRAENPAPRAPLRAAAAPGTSARGRARGLPRAGALLTPPAGRQASGSPLDRSAKGSAKDREIGGENGGAPKACDAPGKTLAGLDPELAATLIAAAADVGLVVDSGGVIRDIAFGGDELSLGSTPLDRPAVGRDGHDREPPEGGGTAEGGGLDGCLEVAGMTAMPNTHLTRAGQLRPCSETVERAHPLVRARRTSEIAEPHETGPPDHRRRRRRRCLPARPP